MDRPSAGVGVLIIRDGKVLLGKRHDDPEKADSALHGEGTWTCPGGKLDFQEGIIECGKREAIEETGLKIRDLEVMSVSNERVRDAHFVCIGLMAREFEGEPSVMEPDEITEWRWFALDDLPEKVFPPSEKIIKNYMEKSFYR
jgi:8-oxo-dGTP diphosphatase